MALARVKTWVASEVLSAADLNAEFNSILNNALSLISPLTGALGLGGFALNNLSTGAVGSPSLNFTGDTDTGLYSSAANTLGVTAGGAAVTLTSTSGLALQNNQPIVPAAETGTPAQHGLFQSNTPKAWANVTVTPTLTNSFNVTSVADGGAGVVTVTLDRDFVNANYAPLLVALSTNAPILLAGSLAGGSFVVSLKSSDFSLVDAPFAFGAFGVQ